MKVDEMIKESLDRLPHKTVTKRERIEEKGTVSIVKYIYKVDAAGNKEEIERSYSAPEDPLELLWPIIVFIGIPAALVSLVYLMGVCK